MNKIAIFEGEDFGTDEAGDAHPAGEADDDHDIEQGWGEEGDDGENEEDGGEAEHDIGGTHEEAIEPAGAEGGDGADEDAQDCGQANGNEPDAEAGLGTIEQAAENIAAEAVGAEPELVVGSL